MIDVYVDENKPLRGPLKGKFEGHIHFEDPCNHHRFYTNFYTPELFTNEQLKVIESIVQDVFKIGIGAGRSDIRKDLKDLLGISEQE